TFARISSTPRGLPALSADPQPARLGVRVIAAALVLADHRHHAVGFQDRGVHLAEVAEPLAASDRSQFWERDVLAAQRLTIELARRDEDIWIALKQPVQPRVQ